MTATRLNNHLLESLHFSTLQYRCFYAFFHIKMLIIALILLPIIDYRIVLH